MRWLWQPVVFRRSHLLLLFVLAAIAVVAAHQIRRQPQVSVKLVCFKQIGDVYHCSNDSPTIRS